MDIYITIIERCVLLMEKPSIEIFVAAHKPYKMPEESIYQPIYVGTEIQSQPIPDGYQADNVGENISRLNPYFNELTAMYWAWKHSKSDIIGLVHYRRYFVTKAHGDKTFTDLLSENKIAEMMQNKDAILPKKRNYYIETTYSQYEHAHNIADLQLARTIIGERCPEYLTSFDFTMKQKKSHRFNMFMMRRPVLDKYCEWLFPILFELSKRIDIDNYSPYQQRVVGFISERLLDVWVLFNSIEYVESPVRFMEKQNWFKKGSSFVLRKFSAGDDLDSKLKR